MHPLIFLSKPCPVWLGSDAVAANSIANIAKNLIVSFCTGLGWSSYF